MRLFSYNASLRLLATIVLLEQSHATSRPTDQLEVAYSALSREIEATSVADMTGWGISYDHLFTSEEDGFGEENSLRDRCKHFVRRSGAIDLLLTKATDRKTSRSEVIADTEILIFWAMDDEPSDKTVASSVASKLASTDLSWIDSTDKRFPSLHIYNYIRISVDKATHNNLGFATGKVAPATNRAQDTKAEQRGKAQTESGDGKRDRYDNRPR